MISATDAECVLCQQPISLKAAERLAGFKTFLLSTAQAEVAIAKKKYQGALSDIKNLSIETPEAFLAVEELGIEDSDLAEAVKHYLKHASERQEAIVRALENNLRQSEVQVSIDFDSKALLRRIEQMKDRALKIKQGEDCEERKKVEQRLAELKARTLLAEHLVSVLSEITRQKQVAAFQLCIEETNTTGIT